MDVFYTFASDDTVDAIGEQCCSVALLWPGLKEGACASADCLALTQQQRPPAGFFLLGCCSFHTLLRSCNHLPASVCLAVNEGVNGTFANGTCSGIQNAANSMSCGVEQMTNGTAQRRLLQSNVLSVSYLLTYPGDVSEETLNSSISAVYAQLEQDASAVFGSAFVDGYGIISALPSAILPAPPPSPPSPKELALGEPVSWQKSSMTFKQSTSMSRAFFEHLWLDAGRHSTLACSPLSQHLQLHSHSEAMSLLSISLIAGGRHNLTCAHTPCPLRGA